MWRYGILHIAILISAIKLVGYIYCVPLIVCLVYMFDYIIDMYGYQRISSMDVAMLYETGAGNHNIGGYYILDKIKFEDLKKMMIDKALTKIRKMNQIQKEVCGIYLWKDIPIEKSSKQIKKLDNGIKTDEQCVQYLNQICDQEMSRDQPLWEYSLLEDYTEDKSALFIRMHHSFTDGAGYTGFMTCVNDKEFQTKGTKKVPKFNIFMRILIGIITPFMLLSRLPEVKSFVSDSQAKKIHEVNEPENGKNKYFASKEIMFEKIRKCYKAIGDATFNEYMFAILSKSLYKMYAAHGVEGAKKIIIMMPVNIKDLPNSIDELILDNRVVGCKIPLTITEDFKACIKDFKPIMKKYLSPLFLFSVANLGWLGCYLPQFIGEFLFHDYYNETSITFSNLPLTSGSWYFCNKEIHTVAAFANVQCGIPFNFVALTYKGKLRVFTMCKDRLKFDSKMLIDLVVENIESDIQKYCKDE